MSDYAQYIRKNRSAFEKAERQEMARVWRKLRAYNPLGARLMFRAQQNAIARAVNDLWFSPTSTDGLGGLLK